MNKMILAAIAALSLGGLTAAPAIAQPPGHEMRGDMRHDGDRGRDRDVRRDSDRGRNWNNRHDNGRHLGHIKQGYRRGMRAPAVYLQPRYYVNDYRRYRLAPPPRGYRWVRPADDRYLLVEITSGLISQALGY